MRSGWICKDVETSEILGTASNRLTPGTLTSVLMKRISLESETEVSIPEVSVFEP